MRALYYILAAVHILAMVVTGAMWVVVDVWPKSHLRLHLRDIRAVHFGCLYLVPWLLGLASAFDALKVPERHWMMFPVGLGALVLFSGIGYLFPVPPDVEPFYYWTRGWGFAFSMVGLFIFVACLLWTASVLVIYAVA
jgi:hypothetical protein